MDKLALIIIALLACVQPSRAESPSLTPGAIECGLSGALTVVEGNTRGSIALDGSWFWKAPGGLAITTAEVGYSHVSDLDLMDIGVQAGWTRRAGSTSLFPVVALAGGVRQEWIGSFADARYPVGFNAGARALVSQRADIRIEYRLRRVLNDPVADFTEHEIRVGLALLFRN